MGHLVGKDLYRQLGRKLDGLTMRAPWNDRLYALLKELYTADEAELAIRMPYGIHPLEEIQRITGFEKARIEKLFEQMCFKGLVIDVWTGDKYQYILSPMIIGIFEFTMMRTDDRLDAKQLAKYFVDYLSNDTSFWRANFGRGKQVGPLRTLPHDDAVAPDEHIEILDYEKASAIIDNQTKFAIGLCSCRHEKLHAGLKKCDVPLETCSSFGQATDFMVRHDFAREVSKSEMLDNLSRAKELGLVMCADNVQKDISFICFCCSCCCNVLLGISKLGMPEVVVTSSYIADSDDTICSECGVCAQVCPINAIAMKNDGGPDVDESICIGCGVCGLKCQTGAMTLARRKQKVLHPETMFQRTILQCLERGTLQNFIFQDPGRVSHKFMRAFVGGFLRLPPVKRSLMSDALRSRFLNAMTKGA